MIEQTYGDRIFRLVQRIERDIHKPDMHSFRAKVSDGVVFVEARPDGISISHMRRDMTHADWTGAAVAAANRLEKLGIDLESVEM